MPRAPSELARSSLWSSSSPVKVSAGAGRMPRARIVHDSGPIVQYQATDLLASGVPMASTPLYKVVYRQIESRIRRGEYGPGGRLLPEVRLATELGVSRGTLRRALAALREQGQIGGDPG